ncbi:ScbA/BarX family gamma-butyrolactone biosynthesis protein [Streptomyces sp. NPDC048106]|uniref:ScbA/BarX family gamma-butyrolactone biosynthesis protein n=1 Tax=Streptomyces sp. NPDC048106 TaxID=3155750 RepID=UPI0034530581
MTGTVQPRNSSLPDAWQPVTNELVHKHDRAEVLLKRFERTGPDTFTVSAVWPAKHSFYGTDVGVYDPMLFIETVRQNVPLLSHVGYEVPFEHRLIWQDFTCEIGRSAMQVTESQATLELRIACSRIVRRGPRMAALTMDVIALREGMHLGTARVRFTSNPPAVYRRLRGTRADLDRAVAAALEPAPPVHPGLVGRAHGTDVVLSPSELQGRWLLRSDTGHPILFDHPVDHVPGMLLLDAARQAAHAVSAPGAAAPVRFDARFHRYVELDAPCWIAAESAQPDLMGRPGVTVRALQNGEVAFSCSVATESPALSRAA